MNTAKLSHQFWTSGKTTILGRTRWMMANFLKGLFLMNYLRTPQSKMSAALNKMLLLLLLLAVVQLQLIMVQNLLLQSPRSHLILIQTKILSSNPRSSLRQLHVLTLILTTQRWSLRQLMIHQSLLIVHLL